MREVGAQGAGETLSSFTKYYSAFTLIQALALHTGHSSDQDEHGPCIMELSQEGRLANN